jgi:Uma2 family endonuclease
MVGAPELVAEIAASSASYDLHAKKRAYERNGVREYLVWRTFDRQVDWFIWEDGEYLLLPPSDRGIVCSREFTGLWLNVDALLAGDMKAVLATLQEGLATLR